MPMPGEVLLRRRGCHQMRAHLDAIVNLLQSFGDHVFAALRCPFG